MYMSIYCAHVGDDSNPQRPGIFAPEIQVARRLGGHVAFRLFVERAATIGRAAHSRRIACAPRRPDAGRPIDIGSGYHPNRTRLAVIVVDASAVLDLLRRVPGADAIELRLFSSGDTLHAPHLIDVEVTQAARRLAVARQLDQSRGSQLLADLIAMPIRRYPHGLLLDRV